MPLTEGEYQRLLESIRIADPRRWDGKQPTMTHQMQARIRALFQLMRWSGLAIQDAVTLARAEIQHDEAKGIYRVITARQKTGTHVSMPIPTNAAKELLAVDNGDERYVFWTGEGSGETLEAAGSFRQGQNGMTNHIPSGGARSDHQKGPSQVCAAEPDPSHLLPAPRTGGGQSPVSARDRLPSQRPRILRRDIVRQVQPRNAEPTGLEMKLLRGEINDIHKHVLAVSKSLEKPASQLPLNQQPHLPDPAVPKAIPSETKSPRTRGDSIARKMRGKPTPIGLPVNDVTFGKWRNRS